MKTTPDYPHTVNNQTSSYDIACISFLKSINAEIARSTGRMHNVTLPEGWSRVILSPLGDSKITDPQGRDRAIIYDQPDSKEWGKKCTICCRYHIKRETGLIRVMDGITELFTQPYLQDSTQILEYVESWLKTYYPDYLDPKAYWD